MGSAHHHRKHRRAKEEQTTAQTILGSLDALPLAELYIMFKLHFGGFPNGGPSESFRGHTGKARVKADVLESWSPKVSTSTFSTLLRPLRVGHD